MDYKKLQRGIEDEVIRDVREYISDRQKSMRYGSGVKHQIRYNRAYADLQIAIWEVERMWKLAHRDRYGNVIDG